MKQLTTRDSIVWTIGFGISFVTSLITGLAAVSAQLGVLGVPEEWLNKLAIAAIISGVVSGVTGKSGNSWFNGDPRKRNRRKTDR